MQIPLRVMQCPYEGFGLRYAACCPLLQLTFRAADGLQAGMGWFEVRRCLVSKRCASGHQVLHWTASGADGCWHKSRRQTRGSAKQPTLRTWMGTSQAETDQRGMLVVKACAHRTTRAGRDVT